MNVIESGSVEKNGGPTPEAWIGTAEVSVAHVENGARVAEEDLVATLGEPKSKGPLFGCNK